MLAKWSALVQVSWAGDSTNSELFFSLLTTACPWQMVSLNGCHICVSLARTVGLSNKMSLFRNQGHNSLNLPHVQLGTLGTISSRSCLWPPLPCSCQSHHTLTAHGAQGHVPERRQRVGSRNKCGLRAERSLVQLSRTLWASLWGLEDYQSCLSRNQTWSQIELRWFHVAQSKTKDCFHCLLGRAL
jgi:hypothetical protein